MKTKIKKIIILMGVCVLFFYIFYSYPRDVDKTFTGIKYRLGAESNKEIETIHLRFKGKYLKNILFGNEFKGKIYINNAVIPSKTDVLIPVISDEISIRFDKFNKGKIEYTYYDGSSNRLVRYYLGDIYVDNNFNKVTICVLESKGKSEKSRSWNSEDGLMISAPALTREEGINISNELMKKALSYNSGYHTLE